MSKVDEELTRRFHRAERPVGSGELFEGLARRRDRRRTLQRVQAGALAVIVLGATFAGFLALRSAFRETGRTTGGEGQLRSNGEIVFANEAEDDRLEIFASQPDGSRLRQLTDTEFNNSDPAVSPDGTMVAYSHQVSGAGGYVLEVIPVEGGDVTWRSAEHDGISDPEWSPDGSRIAYLVFTRDTSDLYVAKVGTDVEERIELGPEVTAVLPTDGLDTLEHPTWSPNGDRIAIAIRRLVAGSSTWDVAVIRPDGTGLEWLVASEDRDDLIPAWSPDGSRIAFLRRTPGLPEIDSHGTDEIWTIAPDGTDEQLVGTADRESLRLGLAWAPDATSILVSDGTWISRMDPAFEGDPRDNFVRLVKGFSPSWQPIPAGSEPSSTVSPDPSISPAPEPEGKDVGLGFNLCDTERLGVIDFLGDGSPGAAWIGVKALEDGTCPVHGRPGRYAIAEDHTGDGIADSWLDLPWQCYVDCVPYDATDLDGNGTEELIVASYFSIMDYFVMTLVPGADGELQIQPILLAEPGHEPAGLIAGEPLRIDAGGDEGYGSQIECDGYPGAPVLTWSWSNHPVETNRPREVHITRIQLQSDGRFHVIGTNDYSVAADQPSGIQPWTGPACGVDWHPSL